MQVPPITIVVEPAREVFGSPAEEAETLADRLTDFQRLQQRLRAIGDVEVEIVISTLCQARPRGLILLDPSTTFAASLAECAELDQTTLPARIVLVNANRSDVLDLLDRFGLAGAIESYRFFVWATQDEPDAAVGFYGLRSVAETIDAVDILGGPYVSDHYCLFGSARYAGLPELLLAYLARYSERFAAVPA